MSKKNEAFWALSRSEKRVAIAKDVIKLVNTNKIKPKSGTYLKIPKRLREDEKLDKAIKEVTCTGCALGACFIGLVDQGDKLRVSDILGEFTDLNGIRFGSVDDNDFRQHLRKVFSPKQLSLIESAFEKQHFEDDKCLEDIEEQQAQAIKFGVKFPSVNSRMIGIMRNIIENKGTFRPKN